MVKKSFVFYESWKQAIDDLSADVQLEIYQAITAYAVNNKITELSPVAKVAFSFIQQDIDRNAKRYTERCARNKEFSLRGGAPKGNKNAVKTTEKLKNNPKQPKTTLYDNDNEDDYESTNVDNKEIPSKEGIKKEGGASSCTSDYLKFIDWMKEQAPYCANPKHFPHQITEGELLKLKQKYSGSQLAAVILQIENRKDLRKRYSNLYRTVQNWAKREYGN